MDTNKLYTEIQNDQILCICGRPSIWPECDSFSRVYIKNAGDGAVRGFVQLDGYIIGEAIMHNFMVNTTCDSRYLELHRFLAHASPSCILSRVALYTYLKC